MHIHDAINLMVRHAKGGIAAVALHIGKPEETLRKEISGKDPKFKLGAITAQMISDYCMEEGSLHCTAYIQAVAPAGAEVLRLPVVEGGVLCTSRTMSEVIKEMSHVSMVTIDAEQDGNISDNDLRRGLQECQEAREAINRHEQALKARHLLDNVGRGQA